MAEQFLGLDWKFTPPAVRALVVDAEGRVARRVEGRGPREDGGSALDAFVGDALTAGIAVAREFPQEYWGTESAAVGRLEPVRQEFARRVPPGMAEQVRLEMPPLGEDGIAIGAARLAMLARTWS